MGVGVITPEDHAWILELSRANEIETSALDASKLEALVQSSFVAVALPQAAYLIAFDQDAAYDSPNFQWFRARMPRFVYVDRIVVSSQERGGGIGRAFYEGVFDAAREAKHDRVVCEVNFDPPNLASDAFHEALGFQEVGQARLENGKGVRYLMRSL
ncbi:MAG TPA: GNAT family N-acetyltransferase [Caulobacterales bacterium]|nr:GNAT family N-acetyltransferase [Caulobacterales bacterium]